jgi:hypothetical protein
MGDARLFDAAVHFLIVHPRNAKDHIDPAILEHM